MSRRQYVEHLSDLIDPADYTSDPQGRRVRLRLQVTPEGVKILGDALQPWELERLLEGLDPIVIQRMLCG